MKLLKYSEHCDRLKYTHSRCVDEEQTEEKFLTDNLVAYFMSQRGCSWQNAIGHTINHLETLRKS